MNNNCKRTLNGVQKYYNLFDKENSVNGEDNIPSKKIKTYGDILENRLEIANSNIKKEEINIDKLPLFILAYILSKTGYPMMMKVMLVSKKWKKAANTKIFYESMLRDMSNEILIKFEIPEHNYELIPQYFKEKSWKEIFQLKRIIKSDPKESDNIEKDSADQTRVLGTKIIDKIGFYEGELKGNKQDGKGILYKIKLGKVYEGDFDKGKITGVGKRTWPNKDTYEGNFLESKRNGEGILKLVGTGEYRGSFVNDKREGDGEMRFENGDVYRGSWKNDMANGFGTFSSKSGYVYEGEWVDNHKSGKGKLIYQRGTYEGDWKNNKAHGKGEIIFKNGTKYIGEMYENSWHGKGQFYWNDGRIYDGDFYYSKQQGQGKIISSDGSICYEGSFRNNRPHGFGLLYLKSGYKYKGNMKNGLKDGNGEIFDSNGRLCMSGEFCEGNYITKNPINNNSSTNSNLINLNQTNFTCTNSFELPSNNDNFNSIQIS